MDTLGLRGWTFSRDVELASANKTGAQGTVQGLRDKFGRPGYGSMARYRTSDITRRGKGDKREAVQPSLTQVKSREEQPGAEEEKQESVKAWKLNGRIA